MTTTVLSPDPIFRGYDNNGNPLVGGKLFTYQAGTTTKLATYTDSTGGTPNTNPVILNSRGEAQVWIPPNTSYKYVLAPSTDTDPPSAPLWTVDNVTQNQLITLYGGVDTGIVNAYVINFTANFSAYTDGVTIIWIPSHTSTSATPTINVNGLGVINIVMPNGAPLVSNAIVAGVPCQILIKSNQAVLMNNAPATYGTYAATVTGFTTTVNVSIAYTILGDVVTMTIPAFSATSNSTSMQISLPTSNPQLVPVSPVSVPIVGVKDNSATLASPGMATVNGLFTGANLVFYKDGTAAGWTAAGTKGTTQTITITFKY